MKPLKGLKTLVMMQLKDKIDMSFLSSWKKSLFKVIMWIIKFALITGIIYIGMYVVSYLRLVNLLSGIPQNFMNVVIIIMFFLSLLVCTVGLSRSLYFAKDNQVLLTLPATKISIFASKIVVYYIYELIRNVTYFLPVFIAYGYINSFPIYYYIWLLVGVAILTAVPVVLGALFSIPMMYVISFLKQNKWLAYSLLFIVSCGVVALVVFVVYKIPANFDLLGNWRTTYWDIQDFLNNFTRIFMPISLLVTMVAGTRYAYSNTLFDGRQFAVIFSVLGIIVLCLVLTFLIVRPLFFKMASSPFEYKRIKVKPKENRRIEAGISVLKKESLLLYRNPAKLYTLLATAIFLPIAIMMLNKFYMSMEVTLSGKYMEIMFNILIILLVVTASNASIASMFSEEGSSAYLIKTNPQSYLKQLSFKLVINFVTMTISLIAATCIFSSFQKFDALTTFELFLFMECVYISHLVWSAEMDLMNPQNAQYQSTGQHVNNPNSIKSTIMSMLLSVLFAMLVFFLIDEGLNMVFVKVLIFAVLFMALRIWLYAKKIKVYYKEKQ